MDTNALISYLDNMAARVNEAAPDCEWVVLSPRCCKGLHPSVLLEVCEHYKHSDVTESMGRFNSTIWISGVSFSLQTERVMNLEAAKPSMMDVLRAAAAVKPAA